MFKKLAKLVRDLDAAQTEKAKESVLKRCVGDGDVLWFIHVTKESRGKVFVHEPEYVSREVKCFDQGVEESNLKSTLEWVAGARSVGAIDLELIHPRTAISKDCLLVSSRVFGGCMSEGVTDQMLGKIFNKRARK